MSRLGSPVLANPRGPIPRPHPPCRRCFPGSVGVAEEPAPPRHRGTLMRVTYPRRRRSRFPHAAPLWVRGIRDWCIERERFRSKGLDHRRCSINRRNQRNRVLVDTPCLSIGIEANPRARKASYLFASILRLFENEQHIHGTRPETHAYLAARARS